MLREASDVDHQEGNERFGILLPLRHSLYRRIWITSLLSNLGYMILSVSAAWTMTLLTTSADKVALVQTALMAPMMCWALVAGAIADMYDRRRVAIIALFWAAGGAAGLAVAMTAQIMTPWLLLLFCFSIGSGMAFFAPSWQASVSEQLPPDVLPQGIALNSISFNIARSIGPAIGGVIIATIGSNGAFAVTTVALLPLIFVLLHWRREPTVSRLPPERIDRAVSSGIRYLFYSHLLRSILIRALAISLAGISVSALLPLVTRDILKGDASDFGILLGAFGVGSVLGAVLIAPIRRHLNNELVVCAATLTLATCIVCVAMSKWIPLTAIALVGCGAGWIVSLTLINVLLQVAVPRWVTGRALAGFQTSIAAGAAIGSWVWGRVTLETDVSTAMLVSACALVATLLLALRWKVPDKVATDQKEIQQGDPDVALAITGRSGPVVLEFEYRIAPDDAREFYNRMQLVRAMRLRNGGFGWSISRDIKDIDRWIERFHYPTWHDYLRQRNRTTPEELAIFDLASRLQNGGKGVKVRRLLERPFGSVRWKEDSPDFGKAMPERPDA